jgi:hypothetical protein
MLVDSVEAELLKQAATFCILRNLKVVMESEKWKKLEVADPAKALEITKKYININLK